MNEKETVLDSGVVETRVYDDDGKLVDIRRSQPISVLRRGHYIPRAPGSIGGHEF